MRAKGGKDKAKANYISKLQSKKILGTYFNERGYVCYDTDELKDYKQHVKKGRPHKESPPARKVVLNGTIRSTADGE